MDNVHDSEHHPSSELENNTSHWTAGPIISSHKRKGLDHTGDQMKMIDMELYILEVFPPKEVAKHMQQLAPDISYHLEEEGLDSSKMNRRFVSFIAHVSLPYKAEELAVEITLKSGQRQNGGVYEQEISIPQNMICVRESPVATVLDSLNNALHKHHWYPPY
ncbi:MAG: hypothetical protein GQ583_10020 [Methyloprofundus sp.]|nr:hypothetical protein [Methyloprofundus sp.]